MSDTTKYYTSWIVSFVCLGLMLLGLNNMMATRSTDGFMGVGLLFGGVIIGLPSALVRHYFRERAAQHEDQQQVAIETLSRMVATEERERSKP